jgi:outer membrane protein TolC
MRTGGAGILLALVLAGCATDDVAGRRESRDAVVERRRRETAEFFATNSAPLTLEQAVGLARERTLHLTQASLDASLANIRKGTAFSAFLPRLDAKYMYAAADKDLVSEPVLLGHSLTLGDSVETAGLTLTQPVFMPNAWLMFFEARHLEQAQKYRLERARQLLDVQVTAQFYETAVADALIRSYESETNSTAALERRIGDLVGEGYATKPDLARVRPKAKNDRYELKKANDRAELARARLADILRFMPGEPALKADGASMMKVLENPRRLTLEDAVMESLTNRLDLFAADRVTKVREIEIYRALTEWLPEIAVAGGGNYANQELLATSQFWSGGIVGAMSLFKGFQSVNDYRKAKEERKAEYEILENRMMAVVVSVIDAYRNRERAEEGAAVARSAMESAQLDYDSAKDRFDEGRETFSHLMDKITALEKAKVRASSAEYARALTEIVLRNAIGENLK